MTREEKQKAINALKISAPVMVVTQEKFNDYIQTLNKVMDWLEQELCEDAISRQATVDFLENHAETYEDVRVKMGFKASASLINNRNNLPPVTPQESRKGHWIPRNSFLLQYKCSVCGWKSEKYNYCSNCGAKMIEEVEE